MGLCLGPNQEQQWVFLNFSERSFNFCEFLKFVFHFEWCCSSPDSNLLMLISWHRTNSKDPPQQPPIGILHCERIGLPDSKVSYATMPALKTPVAIWFRIELAFRVPGIRQWASCIHRTPGWIQKRNPARIKFLPNKDLFY
jgi:hypothetical protein